MNSNNWWAQKLGNPAPAAPAAPRAPLPPMQPQPVPQQFQQPQTNDWNGGYESATLDPKRPVGGADPQGRCPDCGSGNYVATGKIMTQSGPVVSMRCYDCGYPISQSGTGISGIAPNVPAGKAVQLPNGGWNPGTLIGHIDSV